jgi:hypothetical protein
VTGTSEASFEGKSTKTLSSGDNLQAFKISWSWNRNNIQQGTIVSLSGRKNPLRMRERHLVPMAARRMIPCWAVALICVAWRGREVTQFWNWRRCRWVTTVSLYKSVLQWMLACLRWVELKIQYILAKMRRCRECLAFIHPNSSTV